MVIGEIVLFEHFNCTTVNLNSTDVYTVYLKLFRPNKTVQSPEEQF